MQSLKLDLTSLVNIDLAVNPSCIVHTRDPGPIGFVITDEYVTSSLKS